MKGQKRRHLLEEKEEIVILDLKEKQYNSFQYTLPFNKEDKARSGIKRGNL